MTGLDKSYFVVGLSIENIGNCYLLIVVITLVNDFWRQIAS